MSLSSRIHLRYGPAYLARGLFVALLVPMSIIALQWQPGSPIEIPDFLIVWLSAWLFSLLLSMTLALRKWAGVCLHWLVYIGAASIFIYEWRIAFLLQGVASLLWWALFEMSEKMYASYKAANESMERAKILEARIRPHFVFNVLNSLRALSPSGSTIAKALDDGADLLRAALVRTGSFVGYCEERNLLEQYLRLEALRLDDRLQVQWFVDDDVEDENPWMPGFILQPIVENAIRYGIEVHGGFILIELKHIQSYFVIVISNTCPQTQLLNKFAQGLGLAESDVIARLSLLYDAHASYTREFSNGLCRVTIRFPWRLQ